MNKLLILAVLMTLTFCACGDGGELYMPNQAKNTPAAADASPKKPMLSIQALQFHKICPSVAACTVKRYADVFQMLAKNPIKLDDEASDDAENTVKTPAISGSVLHNQIILFGK